MSEGTRARGRLMPAPFAMPGEYSRVDCGAAGVPGAGGPGCWAGLLGVPVGGGPPAFVACCPDRSPAAARPARPLAVRAASFARRVGSKPGQAPQASRRPPIGRGLSLVCCRLASVAADRHRGLALRSIRRPPHQWGLVADRRLGASFRLLASLRCRPPAPRPGPSPSRRPRIQPSLPTFLSPPPISHAIPPRPFQILKSDRRNCNVFRLR